MNDQLVEKINRLKAEKNAVILAHNYQLGAVQDIADYTGDSLGLSVQAANTDADVIVFCGVRFMSETAKILSPDKTVLLPDRASGCPMAAMINAEELEALKSQHPGALVVCYVNTTAEIKAHSDYCCTSSNAVKLVESLPADKKIIFVPDRNLGSYVKEKTGRDIVLYPGYCSTHTLISAMDIREKRQEYPGAEVLAHPECTPDVRELADKLLSTGQMLSYAGRSQGGEFIIATELGILHTLKKENPGKKFYAATENAVCVNMKQINLEKILFALENMQFEIELSEETIKAARKSLDRMLEVIPG